MNHLYPERSVLLADPFAPASDPWRHATKITPNGCVAFILECHSFVGSTTFRSNKAVFGGAISIVNADSDEDSYGNPFGLYTGAVTPDDDGSWDPAVIIYPEDSSDLFIFNNNDASVSGASCSGISRTDIRNTSGSQGHLTTRDDSRRLRYCTMQYRMFIMLVPFIGLAFFAVDDDGLASCNVLPSVALRLEQDHYRQCRGYRYYLRLSTFVLGHGVGIT